MVVQLVDLVIDIFEEIDWDKVEPVIHQNHHDLNDFLHGVNTKFQMAGAFLEVWVEYGANKIISYMHNKY